jgi:putative PIN family toxin of toxin-antitoxin system
MSDVAGVVFDCNVFLQALASPNGPAGRCVDLAFDGKTKLFVSPHVLEEIREVATSPILTPKLKIRPERLVVLLENLPKAAILIPAVAEVWTYARDPTMLTMSIWLSPPAQIELFPVIEISSI